MALHVREFTLPNEDFPRVPDRPMPSSGSQSPTLEELWTESQELIQISTNFADWSGAVTADIASQLRSFLDPHAVPDLTDEEMKQKDKLLKGLKEGTNKHLSFLEKTVEGMFSKRMNLTERDKKQELSQAFSQASNNIWSHMSTFVNNLPGLRTAGILKNLSALNERAQMTYARFFKQRERCEDKLKSLMNSFHFGQVSAIHTQEDSVLSENAWETPIKNRADSYIIAQTKKIMEAIAGEADERLSDPKYQTLFTDIQSILIDCASPRKESEVIKELEKEIEKVRSKADELAKSLRESQRWRGNEPIPMGTIALDRLQVLYDHQTEELSTAHRDKDRIMQENRRYHETVDTLQKQLRKYEFELQAVINQSYEVLGKFDTFERKTSSILQTYQAQVSKLSGLLKDKCKSQFDVKVSVANQQMSQVETLVQKMKGLIEHNAEQARVLEEKKAELKYTQEGIGNHVLDIKNTLESLVVRPKVSLSIQQFQSQGFLPEKKDGKAEPEDVEYLAHSLQVLQARENDLLKVFQSCYDKEINPAVLVSRLIADMKETQGRLNQWTEALSPLVSGNCTPENAKAELMTDRKDSESLKKAQTEATLEEKKDKTSTSQLRHQPELVEKSHSTYLSSKIQELTVRVEEIEEENAYLSQENLNLVVKISEFETEKSNISLNLADLKSSLKELEAGRAEAKHREEELKSELMAMKDSLKQAQSISGEAVSMQPEEVRRIKDEVEEKDREIMHLKTITKNYRNQLCALKTQLLERESICKALQDQQSLTAEKLKLLEQPLDRVTAEAVQNAAELVLYRNKYHQEAATAAKFRYENLELEDKNKALMSALAEVKESDRLILELKSSEAGTTQNFEEEETRTDLEVSNASLNEDWQVLLNLDEAAEVCRKVNFSGRFWALIKLPKDMYSWVALDESPSKLTPLEMSQKYQEIERLMQAYHVSQVLTNPDLTSAISRMLSTLERANLLQLPSLSHSVEVTTVIDAERVKGLVFKLVRLLPNL